MIIPSKSLETHVHMSGYIASGLTGICGARGRKLRYRPRPIPERGGGQENWCSIYLKLTLLNAESMLETLLCPSEDGTHACAPSTCILPSYTTAQCSIFNPPPPGKISYRTYSAQDPRPLYIATITSYLKRCWKQQTNAASFFPFQYLFVFTPSVNNSSACINS